jgi:hypothetical protein
VTGTLARRTYLGDLVQFHVLLPGGMEVVCQRQNERGDTGSALEVGHPVELAWAEDAALVLSRGELAQEDDLRLVDEVTSRESREEGVGI